MIVALVAVKSTTEIPVPIRLPPEEIPIVAVKPVAIPVNLEPSP